MEEADDEQQQQGRIVRRGRWKGRRKGLVLVVQVRKMDLVGISTYLLFNINIKDMFAPAAPTHEDDGEWAVLRDLPDPIAQLDSMPRKNEYMDLAVVGGSNIVAASNRKRTFLLDMANGDGGEVSIGPELREEIHGSMALIPLETGVLYAIGKHPCWTSPSFQALIPSDGKRRRWSWRSLPKPPRELWGRAFRGWLGVGTHIWMSTPDRGTYSFDTAHGKNAWCKEGEWELPFMGRALFVPDLDHLCFGICPHLLCLCAFDLPKSGTHEPVTPRYVWPASFPHEYNDAGCLLITPGSLSYLGDGNFCIAWTMAIEFEYNGALRSPSRYALLLVALQLARDSDQLCLVNRNVRCYDMPPNGRNAYVLQPALPSSSHVAGAYH